MKTKMTAEQMVASIANTLLWNDENPSEALVRSKVATAVHLCGDYIAWPDRGAMTKKVTNEILANMAAK